MKLGAKIGRDWLNLSKFLLWWRMRTRKRSATFLVKG